VAVVNQTTLLMNETLAIIEHLRAVYQPGSATKRALEAPAGAIRSVTQPRSTRMRSPGR